MLTIILGGWGGGNWLPMILPLIALVLIAKGGELLVKYIKKRRHSQ